MKQPFSHSLGAFAVIARLTQYLEITWPIRPATRKWCFVVDSGWSYQETDPTPTRKALLSKQFMNITDCVMTFGFKPCRLALIRVNCANAGVSIIPRFACAFGSFRVASIPMIPSVSATFFASARRSVPRRMMFSRAQLIRPVQCLFVFFGVATRAHISIEPLTGGFVK